MKINQLEQLPLDSGQVGVAKRGNISSLKIQSTLRIKYGQLPEYLIQQLKAPLVKLFLV